MFGAGTIQYSWGLDSFHDGQASTPDVALQQATINLFADMGVQPTTLMHGLVAAVMSTDYAAPVSTITSPTEGMTISAGTSYTIRGTAQDLGGGKVGAVEVSVDGGTTWHPAVGRESWTYTWTPRSNGPVNIRTRATDDSGNIEVPGPGVNINPQQNTGVYSFWDTSTTPASVDSGDGSPVEVGVRFRVDNTGFITGMRFYKAAANSGTHTGHLWDSNGNLLASATFTNETASGWQTVEFSSPVAVVAGMTYVASYTAPKGHYSVSRNYFTTLGVDNGPLHAVSQGAAGNNGLYSYSPGSLPTQSYQASNYWVDVVYNTALAADTTAPTVTKFGQVGNGSVVYTNSQFTVTFSEAINPSSITSNTVVLVKPDNRMVPSGCCPTPGGWCSGCPLLNAVNNTTIAATVTYDTASRTATITPNSPLELATVYTIILNAGGIKDLAGNALAADTWDSFYTSTQAAPVVSSMWSNSTTPGTVDAGDNQAVELGMKFTADTSGTITGARFYKAAANTGSHVASLWSSTGQLLAQGTFVNETASGWQTVNFSSPVAVTAGTTYLISYHTNSGHYSVSRNYFGAQVNSGSLHAPANAGVYAYGANSLFPTASYQASNYFVDVLFSTSAAGDTVAPTVVNFNPFDGTNGVSVSPSIKVYFSEDMDASTVTSATVKLLDGGNLAAPATMTYDQATRMATLTPTAPLASGMTYTIFVAGGSAGVRDVAGNPMAQNTTSSFSTALGTPDNTAPTITSFNPAGGATGVSTTTPINITFSETLNAATVKSNTVYLLKGGNTLVISTLTYNAATSTATITPTDALLFGQSYTIYVLGGPSGVKDLANNALLGNIASVFTTLPAPADTTAPTVTGMAPSGSAVAVNSSVAVTFSEALNASTVTSTNVQLRNTATNAVIATTISYTQGSTTVTLTPTAALANATGYTIFVQGGSSGIKDVAGNALAANATGTFTTVSAADTTAPTVTAISPTSGSNSVAVNAALTVTFSEAMNASTISSSTVYLQGANNAVIATSISYNASTNTATLTPTSSLANSTSYSIVVKGGSQARRT